MNTSLSIPLIGLCALFAATPAQASCGVDIAAAVGAGEAREFGSLRGGLSRAVPGQVVEVSLCREGGGLVYRVLVVPQVADAQARLVKLDARSGAVLN